MPQSTWADPTATWADPVEVWSDEGVTDLDVTFEWSPSTDPGDTPSWEDITTLVRGGRISRGRQSEFDRTSAGKLSLLLDNRARTFDPVFDTDVRPNIRVRVTVGSGADLLPLFDGWIDGLPQAYDPPADATVQLTATDGFKILSRFELDPIYAGVVEADAPYLWWRLADDLPLATTAADSSGNGITGTLKGTPSSTGSLIMDGPGAMSMDGDGDNVDGSADGVVAEAATGATLAAAPVTIEAWIKTGKYGTNVSFICGQTHVVGSTFVPDFALAMVNDTGYARFLAQVGGINVAVTGSTVLRDTGVHHLVGTVDSSRNCRLYVDGVLEGGPTAAGSTTAINSSGGFRVGKPPVGADPGAGSSYRAFKGEICEVATYSRALSAAEVLEHYNAGAAPWANDTTGARVARILNLVGWPSGDRSLNIGASSVGPARGIAGRTALEHLLDVEQTEQGRFFIDGAGRACFRGRNYETALTSEASFTDADPTFVDLMFDFSDANLCNDCTVTRVGGVPQRAQDATSIATYWRCSDDISGVLFATDNEAKGMAEWRVLNYSTPVLRPSRLTFRPYRDLPDLYGRVLARELGDRISVTRTLSGDDITVDAVIEGIEHEFRPGPDWVTSWNLSPLMFGQFGPDGGSGQRVWTLSGPGASAEIIDLSKLDNNNRLGN